MPAAQVRSGGAVRRVRRKVAYPIFVAFCACWIPTLPLVFLGGVGTWLLMGLFGTAVLFFFGGPALKAFSFAIMAGVVVGTYSSIFVASPIVLYWSRKRGINLRRELLDANLEAQVNPAGARS